MSNEESRRPSFVTVKSYGSTGSKSSIISLMPEDDNRLDSDQMDAKAKASPKKEKTCCGIGLKKLFLVMGLLATVLVVAVICVSLGLGVSARPADDSLGPNPVVPIVKGATKTKYVPPISSSTLGNYSKAAVSVDGKPCADIGLDVLKRNGTAVDAAIAALFCDGLYSAHSMGIGGGFLMTIFIKETGEIVTLNARETAPELSHPDMFNGDQQLAQRGALAAAVPGEVKGYWEAKKRYGNPDVSWASLIQPSIDMCRQGVYVSFSAANAMEDHPENELIFQDPGMKSRFVNPATNQTWKEGDFYKCEDLADTLERIATHGADDFYTGQIAKNLVKDIQSAGGIISMEDMKNYEVKWEPSVSVKIGDNVFHSVPPPGSGTVLAYIMNIMSYYHLSPGDDQPLFYHRLAEAFKYAYAIRTKLGDPNDEDIAEEVLGLVKNMTSDTWAFESFSKINDSFTINDPEYYGADFSIPNDHGTAHCSVVSQNGDAVTVTSTINLHYGAMYLSPSTGIIINDEMDDFSYPNITNNFGVPPSSNNFVKPGKRPLSSMAPAIVTDGKGNLKLVIGAAGGTKITTSIAYTSIRNLWFQENIKQAIDSRRIHHQLVPMQVDYEVGLDEDVSTFLMERKHKLRQQDLGKSVVCGITKEENGRLLANADFRKDGGVAGF
ncbi:hypothetical protein TCAL_02843 [Tigriopus californicus]|uniref:Gamma-glutamyltransferase n=1 Tax=Tigriopus californicus TaxID=6832 RepID=A0A553NYA0_TIGCA|nr:glutathione hydrolase 1 proenzyme-like isoform X2 [Tigriopus californicus]TRY70401.1 hypothetical protein TCAL_02843 [Tigriopus californicus]